MEPDLSKEVYAALYAPTGGIVCPFELNLALAENACQNGAEFILIRWWSRLKRRKADIGFMPERKHMRPVVW